MTHWITGLIFNVIFFIPLCWSKDYNYTSKAFYSLTFNSQFKLLFIVVLIFWDA